MYETIDPDTGQRAIMYESRSFAQTKIIVNNFATSVVFDPKRGTHKRNNKRFNRRKKK